MSKNVIRVATEVVFGGNNPRPDEAFRELGRAGHTVAWMPEEDREPCLDPCDEFIEVLTIITDDVPMYQVWREIDAVANQYCGYTNQSYFLSPGEEWVPGMWSGEA